MEILTRGAVVRHRIDGLENFAMIKSIKKAVRHRIDGLEIVCREGDSYTIVRHRIDGLERCRD